MSGTATARTFFWHITRGPVYTCRDQDNIEVLQVHMDLATPAWRVIYPSGASNIHSWIGNARKEAEKHMASLGDDRDLSFIVY